MTDTHIPPEAFEGLMKKVFVEGAVHPGLFWDASLRANLYVPLVGQMEEAGQAHDQDVEEWPVQLGKDSKGTNVLWLFTSPDTMEDYTEKKMPFIALPGQTMFEKIKEAHFEVVLIGPGGITLRLDPNLVKSLAEGQVPAPPEENVRQIPKETRVMVGRAGEEAKTLEDCFNDLFKGHPNILEACFIRIEDDMGPRLLLGVQLLEESREKLREIAALVAGAAEGILEAGKVLDVTLLNGSLKEAFVKYGHPFYKKVKEDFEL